MTMYVKRIRDLIKEGLITVKDPNKGFTVADLCLTHINTPLQHS